MHAAPRFAAALKRCTQLTSLRLGGTALGKAGVFALADTVTALKVLRSLDVGGTAAGTDALTHLSGGLRKMSRLTKLCFAQAEAWAPGVLSMLEASRSHPGMKVLAFADNSVDTSAAQCAQIGRALACLPELQSVSLGRMYHAHEPGAYAVSAVKALLSLVAQLPKLGVIGWEESGLTAEQEEQLSQEFDFVDWGECRPGSAATSDAAGDAAGAGDGCAPADAADAQSVSSLESELSDYDFSDDEVQ